MPRFRTMALLLSGLLCSLHAARAQSSPPPFVGEEVRRAQSDFATGGIRRLNANWNACIDQARGSQDANAAARCVVYGYSALLLGDTDGAAARTPWMRHLTADIIAPGQIEMLEIMGIPDGPRQAWLDRYQLWAAERYAPDVTSSRPPNGRASYGGGPAGREPDSEGRETQPSPVNLAQAADGKYPREALREPGIADAVRQLIGPPMLARLADYSFDSPMEFDGRYTVGIACEPHACGVSEMRLVVAPDDVWLAILKAGRLRIYGNPPRPVHALLLRDRNRIVWRGPVEDMSHPVPPPVVRAAADPGVTPRMSIAPRPFLVDAEPVMRAQPDADVTEVRLRNHDGTFEVPVTINGAMTLPFAIDSGASDVSVSADVMEKLIQAGTVSRADFQGKQIYHLADGSAVASETFRIHSLKVGDREVRNVLGSITNDADSLLLGQSFLKRFRSWSIDNQRQVLLLK